MNRAFHIIRLRLLWLFVVFWVFGGTGEIWGVMWGKMWGGTWGGVVSCAVSPQSSKPISIYQPPPPHTSPPHTSPPHASPPHASNITTSAPRSRRERTIDPHAPLSHATTALDVPLFRHHNQLYVRCAINGQDGGYFLFDTGASLNIVAQGLANRLNLPPVPNNPGGNVIGIGGTKQFNLRLVDSWTLVGKTQYIQLHVDRLPTLPLDLNRRAGVDTIQPGGIVGFPALIHQPFSINDATHTLTIHPRSPYSPRDDETKHPMILRGQLPYVWADIFEGRRWIRVPLLIDTGQDREITLPLNLFKRYPGLASVPVAGNGRATGIGGTITTRETWLRSLRLFDIELRDLPVSFEPTSQQTGRIGMALLQHFRLTFDTPQRAIYVTWQPQ